MTLGVSKKQRSAMYARTLSAEPGRRTAGPRLKVGVVERRPLDHPNRSTRRSCSRPAPGFRRDHGQPDVPRPAAESQPVSLVVAVAPTCARAVVSCSVAAAWARRSRRWRAPAVATCVWATGQYLSYAKPGEVLDIDVTHRGRGAPDHPGPGRVPRRPTARSSPSTPPLGRPADRASGQWEPMPDVPPPEECADRPHPRMPVEGSITTGSSSGW